MNIVGSINAGGQPFSGEALMRTMRTKNIFHLRTGMLLFLVLFFPLCSAFAWADEIIDPGNFLIGRLSPPSATGGATLQTRPDEGLLETAYAGGETLRYTVSWLGIPAGELVMQVSRIAESSETFALEITARSAGLLAIFYPVEDHFRTEVQGKMRLLCTTRRDFGFPTVKTTSPRRSIRSRVPCRTRFPLFSSCGLCPLTGKG
jgi:hypothetical protein